MKKGSSLITLTLVATLSLLLGALLSWLYTTKRPVFGVYVFGERRPIDAVLDVIQKHYVDSLDMYDLQMRLLPKLIEELDPHSAYIPKEQSDLEMQRLEGSFFGIGVWFNTIIDTAVVMEVIPGGPSALAGLQAGDRLLKADGKMLVGNGITADSIRSLLLGKEGVPVSLHLLRDGAPLAITVVRGAVPIKSVDAHYMVNDSVGLIRITQWARNTSEEFLQAYASLSNQGLKKLIIDLRDNAGGYLHSATDLSNEFLQEDDMIVYTEGKAFSREEYRADGMGLLKDIPLVVLVNEFSASSSEIFAGAMQDHDRAAIVGRRTFGKGLVQTAFTLPDSSQLRLTVARYHTPSGRYIQSDYHLGDIAGYEENFRQRILSPSASKEAIDSTLLKEAPRYRTARGRIVYGGLGILPDNFVAPDLNGVNAYFIRCSESGTLQQYAFNYIDKNRKRLSACRNVQELIREINKIGLIEMDYALYAADNGVALRPAMFQESRELIRRTLLSLTAQYILGSSEAYKIYHAEDPYLKVAQSVLDTLTSTPYATE